ncbi:leucine-rich repeat domain-containing protein [Reichenbachiella carrageenanivorans]|uniref:Leucine-rich repeat domain-containing protein n=1 Tax=Reichenbachiella carrageenanivorans TaxID=2979869 RepID=A0ABY6D5Z9_9BACT|nr:leucine-rich repeat domain-containing protein [Reichenbachiella carrageenanivorans]UXX81274.1 leucine-rich repeat domain-containing protein [Reichenbachiella carrageenanivorans]
MVKPSVVLPGRQAKRGKVFLVYFGSAFVLFLVAGFLGNKENNYKWENPEGVTKLNIDRMKFDAMPERLLEFEGLEELSLSENNIEVLDQKLIQAMPALHTLNLSGNPIKEIPDWLAETSIQTLVLDDTQVENLSIDILHTIPNLSYENTPLAKREAELREVAKANGEPSSESLSDYALRQLMGKDYGYEKQFKKGTLYYTKGVDETKVDSLGDFMIENGYFIDEREISMQLTYKDVGVNAYELRAVYSGDANEELPQEYHDIFTQLAYMVSHQVFEGKPVHFHLTDEEFEESLFVLKSTDYSL